MFPQCTRFQICGGARSGSDSVQCAQRLPQAMKQFGSLYQKGGGIGMEKFDKLAKEMVVSGKSLMDQHGNSFAVVIPPLWRLELLKVKISESITNSPEDVENLATDVFGEISMSANPDMIQSDVVDLQVFAMQRIMHTFVRPALTRMRGPEEVKDTQLALKPVFVEINKASFIDEVKGQLRFCEAVIFPTECSSAGLCVH